METEMQKLELFREMLNILVRDEENHRKNPVDVINACAKAANSLGDGPEIDLVTMNSFIKPFIRARVEYMSSS
jgi:hypothetical protein